jgi:hypothetical protein
MTVMKKGLTIAAIAALTLGAAACHKSEGDTANVSAEDNMLVPADENAMMGDSNDMTSDNMTSDNSAMAGNDANAM